MPEEEKHKVPSLVNLCAARLLSASQRFDEDVTPILLEILGLDSVIVAASLSPSAFGGLLTREADFSLIDACRRRLASQGAVCGAPFFDGLLVVLKERPPREAKQLDAIVCVAKAFLGNDRFKRDMIGPVLPKRAADSCRALRNCAQHLGEERRVFFAKSGPKGHWRFQDLRLHKPEISRYRNPATTAPPTSRGNPHFPGYDH